MITSPRNAKIERAVRLKKRALREQDRRFLVEGAQAVGEALDVPAALETLFHTDAHPLVDRAREHGAAVVHVSEGVMGRLTSTVTPQGLVGVARFVDVPVGSITTEAGCVAVLHAVRDPGNAGTVLRSADGAGAGAVVFSSASVDVYNAKTVRASAGSLFHLPVVRGVETREAARHLRDNGFRIYAATPDGDTLLHELNLVVPSAFLFGNEAWGLPDDVAALADTTVRIPLGGRAESLNLAAAATLCLFEWARQRRAGRRVELETIIAAAAHDIRSPLTAMKGFGYALSTRWDTMPQDQRELMLGGIVYDTDRMVLVVKQLVDAARLVSGKLDLFPERVNVGDVVRALIGSFARDPDHPEIVWAGQDVVAMVDPERLKTALAAFVESAVWWAREGPIRVSAALRDGRLVVEVFRDGADPVLVDGEALFQPRPPGSGAGSKIGLFVARGAAEARGGTATAVVGRGLTFRLDVPSPEPEHGG